MKNDSANEMSKWEKYGEEDGVANAIGLEPVRIAEDVYEICRKIEDKDDRYVIISQRSNRLSLTDDQCRLLFTPMTCDIRFLLCKQIIREVGEITNLRACGIQAVRRASTVEIEIIMPKRIWKNLK